MNKLIWILLFSIAFSSCDGNSASDSTNPSTEGDTDWLENEMVTEDCPFGRFPEIPTSKRLLARKGTQSYLWFDQTDTDDDATFCPAALYWRQYSDFMSHFDIFRPILDPLLEVQIASEKCRLENHEWRGAILERRSSCGSVSLVETSLYTDDSTLVIHLSAQNGPEDVTIELVGQSALETIGGTIENAANGGLDLTLSDQYANLWSDPTPVTWNVALRPFPEPDSITVDPREQKWSFSYLLKKMLPKSGCLP